MKVAVTQTPVKDHQLTLMWKSLIIIIIITMHKTLHSSDDIRSTLVVKKRRKRTLGKDKRKNKQLDLVGELKKLWSMKVTVIQIIGGILRTIPKGLERRLKELKIRGRIETIQTTALLRSARILSRVLENWGNLLSVRLQWKTTS